MTTPREQHSAELLGEPGAVARYYTENQKDQAVATALENERNNPLSESNICLATKLSSLDQQHTVEMAKRVTTEVNKVIDRIIEHYGYQEIREIPYRDLVEYLEVFKLPVTHKKGKMIDPTTGDITDDFEAMTTTQNTLPTDEQPGYSGTLYGVSILWETNAFTGKVDMTPDEVMESVKAIVEAECQKAREEGIRDFILSCDDMAFEAELKEDTGATTGMAVFTADLRARYNHILNEDKHETR
jgi:hypothetical protein